MIINAILLSENGNYLVSSGWDGKIILWNISNGSILAQLPMPNDCYVNTLAWANLVDSKENEFDFVLAGGKNGEMALVKLL